MISMSFVFIIGVVVGIAVTIFSLYLIVIKGDDDE